MRREERVARGLPAKTPADRGRDQEQREIEQRQPDRQIDIEPMKPSGHVAADRRVREVHLEHTNPSTWSTGAERQVDLDRLDTRGSAVIRIGVDMRETGDHTA